MRSAESTGDRRGRYREGVRNDALVLEAARDVFSLLGMDAPVSAIANRAGVGIGTLYRRYGSKDELVQRLCVLAMEQVIEAAELGLREVDAWTGLVGFVRACVASRSGAFTPFAGSIGVTDAMIKASADALRLGQDLVGRAHATGDLRLDVSIVDLLLLVEQFSRRLTGDAADVDRRFQGRLLAIAISGLRRSGSEEPLEGPAPTADWYAARWGDGSPSDLPHESA